MVLAIKQQAFLVDHVFRNGGKCINAGQKKFFKQFPDAKAPHSNVVGRLIKKNLPNWRCKRRFLNW